MIKNYFIIAVRNAIRNKLFSIINILGLAIGIACSLYITYWVRDELSYDKFHEKADQIYRVYWHYSDAQTRTPHPLAQALVNDYPEIENAVSISPIWGSGLTIPTITVKYGEKQFDEKGFYSADSTFFKVFSFKLLRGNPAYALKEPGGIIISEKMANKYFGDEDPLDKMITIIYGEEINLKVTGVIENIPENSHFKFDFLISYVSLKYRDTGEYYTWADFGHFNYILLKKSANVKEIEGSLYKWSKKYIEWPDEYINALETGRIGFRLQAVTDIHLHSHLKWELQQNGDIIYVWIFSSLAILIIVIACINFMNLSTAKSSKRAKEIGIRKVSGAKRFQIIGQFMGESFLTVFISLLLAVILFELFRPAFNNLTQKQLTFDYTNWVFLRDLLGLLIFISLMAGAYPALFISKYKPIDVLKGNNKSGNSSVVFRRIMVIFQFSISAILIACTLVISQQLNFLNNQKLGINSGQMIVVPLKDRNTANHIDEIEEDLLKNENILEVTAVSNIPGHQFNLNPIRWIQDENTVLVSELHVDYNFFKTLNLDFAGGRAFSKDFSTDENDAFIINEAAAKQFNWENAVNQKIIWYDDEITRNGTIIGVVKDFHFQSLHKNISPLIIKYTPNQLNYLLVKIDVNKLDQVNLFIQSKFKEMNFISDYEYFFLDDDIAALYKTENQIKSIFFYFTLFAIFISCLGLFGLALFLTEQRTKEIGIRRVHGSSIINIMLLLSKDFLKWVLFAVTIAIPIAWFGMNNWLNNFAFKIDNYWWVFIVSGVLSLLIAFLTISYQTYRTATKNPIDCLRYE